MHLFTNSYRNYKNKLSHRVHILALRNFASPIAKSFHLSWKTQITKWTFCFCINGQIMTAKQNLFRKMKWHYIDCTPHTEDHHWLKYSSKIFPSDWALQVCAKVIYAFFAQQKVGSSIGKSTLLAEQCNRICFAIYTLNLLAFKLNEIIDRNIRRIEPKTNLFACFPNIVLHRISLCQIATAKIMRMINQTGFR